MSKKLLVNIWTAWLAASGLMLLLSLGFYVLVICSGQGTLMPWHGPRQVGMALYRLTQWSWFAFGVLSFLRLFLTWDVKVLRPAEPGKVRAAMLACGRFLRHLWPGQGHARAALVAFVLLSAGITYFGRNERSGWNKIEQPTDEISSSVSLIGWSSLTPEALPLMDEDAQSLQQVALFCGAETPIGFRFLRGLQGFAGALFAPFLGMIHGLLLANYLLWAAAAWATWRFTIKVFNDPPAAMIAVILVAGGMGWVVHIGDYGAHLMSFTVYYLGVWLIYESRVWAENRPLRVHLLIGFSLGLACLVYNTGLELVVGYVLVAMWKNRWQYVLLASLIASFALPGWNIYLNYINSFNQGIFGWYDYAGVQQYYMDDALPAWIELIRTGRFVETLRNTLIQFLLFVESPAVLLLGFVALAALPKRLAVYWYFGVFMVLPLAVGIWVYSDPVGGLGYLIYGISILLFAALGGMLARLIRQNGPWWPAVTAILVLLVASHVLWSTAHFWGYIGPVKTYFFPFDYARDLLFNQPAQVMSMTGREPTPVLFGGAANLVQAGVYLNPERIRLQPSLAGALISRLYYFSYLAPLVILLILPEPPAQKRPAGCLRESLMAGLRAVDTGIKSTRFLVFVVVWMGLTATALMLRTSPTLVDQWHAVILRPGENLRYTVTVSETFIDALARFRAAYPESRLRLFIQASAGDCQAECHVGDQCFFSLKMPQTWRGGTPVRADDFIRALRDHKALTISVKARKYSTLAGWQRNGLDNREMSCSNASYPGMLPALELRLTRRDKAKSLIFAGF